ncbi:MAG: c-type cytochrome [Bdellovibrionales bacterium]|nr:c-type cytochrome [Bdellovibrionales bacterium]
MSNDDHNQSEDTYNKGGFYAFLFSMGFSLLFFVYIAFVHPGVDLKEIPESEMQAEQTLAEGGEAEAEPAKKVDVSNVKEPWLTSEDLVAHGATVYKTNCAICHGDKGLGDGMAGKGLNPPPRNLVEGGWKNGGSRIALYETLQKGLEGTSMAAFGHLPKVDRWALVHWIQSVSKDVTPDEDSKVAAFAKGAE